MSATDHEIVYRDGMERAVVYEHKLLSFELRCRDYASTMNGHSAAGWEPLGGPFLVSDSGRSWVWQAVRRRIDGEVPAGEDYLADWWRGAVQKAMGDKMSASRIGDLLIAEGPWGRLEIDVSGSRKSFHEILLELKAFRAAANRSAAAPTTTAHKGQDDRGGPEEVLDRSEVLRAADCIRRLCRGGEPEP